MNHSKEAIEEYGRQLLDAVKKNKFHKSECGIESVEYILSTCPQAIDEKENIYSIVMVDWATFYGHIDVIKYLISIGASPDSTDERRTPAILIAAEKGYNEIIELLVESGANVNAKSHHFPMNALHHAARNTSPELVRFLVNNNIDIDYQDFEGRTALMHALASDDLESAKILMAAGASIYLKSNPGAKTTFFTKHFSLNSKDCANLMADAKNGVRPTCEEVGIKPASQRPKSEYHWLKMINAEAGRTTGIDIV